MITTDSPLISTSSGEVQRALVNVGSTILPTLFKDALKASAILGLKMESRSSLKRRCTLFPDCSSIMSLLPDLSTTSVVDLSGETNFIASAAKAEATVRRKVRRERFSLDAGVSALDQEKSAMAR